jgi:hypothetical protein
MKKSKCAECKKEFKEDEMEEGMYFDSKTKTIKFKLLCEKCADKMRGKKKKIETLCECCKCKIIGKSYIQEDETGNYLPFCCKSCAIHYLTLKCKHCMCLIVENPYAEIIGKKQFIFCCKSCAEAFKEDIKQAAQDLRYIG